MSLKRAHWQLKFETFNKQISKLHYACSNIDLILVSKEEKSKTDLTKKKKCEYTTFFNKFYLH